jgi:hypothetical protein
VKDLTNRKNLLNKLIRPVAKKLTTSHIQTLTNCTSLSMFRIDPEIKRKEAIHKLLNYGFRFCVVENGKIKESWRYEYEGLRKYKKDKITPIMALI